MAFGPTLSSYARLRGAHANSPRSPDVASLAASIRLTTITVAGSLKSDIILIDAWGSQAPQVTGGIPMRAANDNTTPPPRSFLTRLIVRSWEYRHPGLLWSLRFAGGLVLLGLGVLLLSYGSWWGLLPLAGSAGAFFGGYRIYQITRSQPAA